MIEALPKENNQRLKKILVGLNSTTPLLILAKAATNLQTELLLIVNATLKTSYPTIEKLVQNESILFITPLPPKSVSDTRRGGKVRNKSFRLRHRKAEIERGIEFINLASPPPQKPRILIIEAIEAADKYAANRLLSFLENLPLGGRVILTTSSPEDLLLTIRSRCIELEIDTKKNSQVKTKLAEYQTYAKLINEIFDLKNGLASLRQLLPFKKLEELIQQLTLLPEKLIFFASLLELLTPDSLATISNLLKQLCLGKEDPSRWESLFGYSDEQQKKLSLVFSRGEEILESVINLEAEASHNPSLDFDLQKSSFIANLFLLMVD